MFEKDSETFERAMGPKQMTKWRKCVKTSMLTRGPYRRMLLEEITQMATTCEPFRASL